MRPPDRITFFVVNAHQRDWVFDCTNSEAVFVSIHPQALSPSNPQGNHHGEESLEEHAINLTLKGLNRGALVRINTAYEEQEEKERTN